uniref:Uncharacterized protein n=1 Tax=Anguilla anguilla TaxID=7936 RepID=A0A0E9XF82_ANGAN
MKIVQCLINNFSSVKQSSRLVSQTKNFLSLCTFSGEWCAFLIPGFKSWFYMFFVLKPLSSLRKKSFPHLQPSQGPNSGAMERNRKQLIG